MDMTQSDRIFYGVFGFAFIGAGLVGIAADLAFGQRGLAVIGLLGVVYGGHMAAKGWRGY